MCACLSDLCIAQGGHFCDVRHLHQTGSQTHHLIVSSAHILTKHFAMHNSVRALHISTLHQCSVISVPANVLGSCSCIAWSRKPLLHSSAVGYFSTSTTASCTKLQERPLRPEREREKSCRTSFNATQHMYCERYPQRCCHQAVESFLSSSLERTSLSSHGNIATRVAI
jgi:hypothetical protein